MKCIIAGCRYIKDYKHVVNGIKAANFTISEVVSGGAAGCDALGERWAKENSIVLQRFPARWDLYGRSAGPIRNEEMAQYADALIAIWDGRSSGTKDMITRAQTKNLNVYIHRVDEEWWVSSKKMTFLVVTVDNIIIDSAPIGRKFVGQHLIKLLKWMQKQGDLKVEKLCS